MMVPTPFGGVLNAAMLMQAAPGEWCNSTWCPEQKERENGCAKHVIVSDSDQPSVSWRSECAPRLLCCRIWSCSSADPPSRLYTGQPATPHLLHAPHHTTYTIKPSSKAVLKKVHSHGIIIDNALPHIFSRSTRSLQSRNCIPLPPPYWHHPLNP